MLKKISLVMAFATVSIYCSAQNDSAKTRRIDQYIGVQANLLFRQILNLSNNTAPVSNPYLLTYSLYSAKKGWGGQIGFGYVYQKLADKNAPANHRSEINNLFYRAGVGRKIKLGKKFESSFGLDFVGDYQVDKSFSSSATNFGSSSVDSTFTTTASKVTSMGGGLEGCLAYHISERILISTEASYYFISSKQKQNVLIIDKLVTNLTSTPKITETTTNSNLETNKTAFTFSVPVALCLVIKF